MKTVYQMIPIEKLKESKFNTRKGVDQAKLDELTASVKSVGVLTPLLARPIPKNGGYELAAGSRRLRAAKAAGIKQLPVIVRDMDDKTLLEIIMIENLQREDVHPLDEAAGYHELIKKHGYDAAGVAEKIGKSESYIWKRLKLSTLIPEAQKAFADERCTVGHAIRIARLQPEEQKEVVESFFSGKEYQEEISAENLGGHIAQEYHHDLHAAPFSKKDSELIKAAGSCVECPKRTGYTPALFPDIEKKDTCTDPQCFNAKIEAHIARWIQDQTAKGKAPLRLSQHYHTAADKDKDILRSPEYRTIEKKNDRCEHAREGIIAEKSYGAPLGTVLTVCAEKKCKKHFGSSGGGDADASHKAAQRRQQAKDRIEATIRERTLDAILGEKISSKDQALKEAKIQMKALLRELWAENIKNIAKRHGLEPVKRDHVIDYGTPLEKYIDGCSRADMDTLTVELALAKSVWDRWQHNPKKNALAQMAAARGVNVKKIEGQVRKEVKEKEEKKAAKKAAKAKPKSKERKPAAKKKADTKKKSTKKKASKK